MSEVFRFIVVGVFGNILNYLIFLFLFKIIGVNYLISGAVGFISPLPILFFLNRNWTFQSNVKTSRINLYLLTNIFGLGVHSSTQYIVFEFLGVPKIFSQILGQISSATLNFLLSKFYIFKDK